MSQIQAIHADELEGVDSSMWPKRLEALFDLHQRRLYCLARRMCRDAEESRDLVQETFLRAARSRRSVPSKDNEAEAWLVRVLINLCRDRQRKISVRQRPWPTDPAPLPADPESAAVARATVRYALARLAPRRRAIVVLRELEDVPVTRIAELLGLARVTVRWHLGAARKELAEILLQEPGGSDP